jgi:hypothetical protein
MSLSERFSGFDNNVRVKIIFKKDSKIESNEGLVNVSYRTLTP